MFRNPFRIGDAVLASRLENGEDHEPGKVIDSYELLMGAESKPMVVVEFEDGERKYLIGGPPNVLPAPASEKEDEAADGEVDGDEAGEADAEVAAVAEEAEPADTAAAAAESSESYES